MNRNLKPIVEQEKLNTGKMRNRIIIQEYDSKAVNENGYPNPEWVTIKKPWAKIKTVKGSETISGSAEVNTKVKRFIIRPTDGLHEKQRIIHRDIVYDIQAILEDDEEGATYTIVAISTGNKVMS
ncbi:phage head closure protein [Lysinibacillus sp. NPDC093210]|uniref:phage head closure protein n=1 Tax=Lysinibacillus sp. NPDC093210 TaxID=3364133 RepID=UPI0037F76785